MWVSRMPLLLFPCVEMKEGRSFLSRDIIGEVFCFPYFLQEIQKECNKWMF